MHSKKHSLQSINPNKNYCQMVYRVTKHYIEETEGQNCDDLHKQGEREFTAVIEKPLETEYPNYNSEPIYLSKSANTAIQPEHAMPTTGATWLGADYRLCVSSVAHMPQACHHWFMAK